MKSLCNASFVIHKFLGRLSKNGVIITKHSDSDGQYRAQQEPLSFLAMKESQITETRTGR